MNPSDPILDFGVCWWAANFTLVCLVLTSFSFVLDRGQVHLAAETWKPEGKYRRALPAGEACRRPGDKVHQRHVIHQLHQHGVQVLERVHAGLEQPRLQGGYVFDFWTLWVALLCFFFLFNHCHSPPSMLIFPGWHSELGLTHPVPLQPPHLLRQLFLRDAQPGGPVALCSALRLFHSESCGRELCGSTFLHLPGGGSVGAAQRLAGRGQGLSRSQESGRCCTLLCSRLCVVDGGRWRSQCYRTTIPGMSTAICWASTLDIEEGPPPPHRSVLFNAMHACWKRNRAGPGNNFLLRMAAQFWQTSAITFKIHVNWRDIFYVDVQPVLNEADVLLLNFAQFVSKVITQRPQENI